MPTLTTNYGFSKPLVNDATDADLWGGQLNTNWDDIDSLLNGDKGDITIANGVWSIDDDVVGVAELEDDFGTDYTDATITASDEIIFADVSDSNLMKKDTVQGVLDLVDIGYTTNSAVATTSGTSVDSNGTVTIPSTATQIRMAFNGVSTSGSSVPQIQIGDSGGLEATGYSQRGGYATAGSSATTGFIVSDNWNASDVLYGEIVFTLVASNTWSAIGTFAINGQNKITHCGGIKTLSDTLDRVGITTIGGSNTFDAGSFYVTYI